MTDKTTTGSDAVDLEAQVRALAPDVEGALFGGEKRAFENGFYTARNAVIALLSDFADLIAQTRAAPAIAAPTAPTGVTREFLERCLSSMKQAVTFGETGTGRPPSQTCMFEIEELEAFLSAPTATAEPVAIPEGWPTNEMIQAGWKAGLSGQIGSGFRAMLAAMPTIGTVELADCGTCGGQVTVPVNYFAAPAPQQAAPLTDAPAQLQIGVSVQDNVATIVILQPLADGKIGMIYSGTHPKGDSTGRAEVMAGSAASAGDARDAARLDFMVAEECYFDTLTTNGGPRYRLYWPHLAETQSECFGTPREAIDAALDRAAMAATKEKKQ